MSSHIPHDATLPRLEGIAALAVAAGVKICLSCLDEMEHATSPYTRAGLASGIIVQYARSFETVRDDETGDARAFSPRGVAGFDRKIHNALLSMRDKYIAHAGHAVNDYQLLYLRAQARFGLIDAEGRNHEVELNIDTGSQARASFPEFFEDAQALRHHFQSLLAAARGRLSEALLEHEGRIQKRIQDTGQMHPPGTKVASSRNFVKLSEQSIDPKLPIHLSSKDMMFSEPKPVENLGIRFLTVHYRHILKNGMPALTETIEGSL